MALSKRVYVLTQGKEIAGIFTNVKYAYNASVEVFKSNKKKFPVLSYMMAVHHMRRDFCVSLVCPKDENFAMKISEYEINSIQKNSTSKKGS